MSAEAAVAASRWTPALVERMCELAGSGASATEIASELGSGLTRNAVLGKLSRMGVPMASGRGPSTERQAAQTVRQHARRRAAQSGATPARTRPQRPAVLTRARHIDHDMAAEIVSAYAESPARRDAFRPDRAPAAARIVPLTALRHGECKWPLFEDGPHLFCGAPVTSFGLDGRLVSYCEAHAAMARPRRAP